MSSAIDTLFGCRCLGEEPVRKAEVFLVALFVAKDRKKGNCWIGV